MAGVEAELVGEFHEVDEQLFEGAKTMTEETCGGRIEVFAGPEEWAIILADCVVHMLSEVRHAND